MKPEKHTEACLNEMSLLIDTFQDMQDTIIRLLEVLAIMY